MAPKENLTGFDLKRFVASSGQPYNDPWRRREAWRYTGPFSRMTRFRGLFPGFGLGAGAFLVYLGVETVFFPDDHHESGHH